MSASRRQFLSAALVGLTAKGGQRISGGFANESALGGHKLRDREPFRRPGRQERVAVVIVGGGIAGLSAAWRLDKKGFRDFVVVEMETEAGGNSRWGENEVSRYPWAAHYLPVPNKRAELVRELCEELGLLRPDGHWDDRHLCHSEQERLFLHGRWQDAIEPEIAATARDREEYRRFLERVAEFRGSGEFAIPMEAGAKPSPLDGMTVTAWLDQQGFRSPYLRWYIDYACRDDYGARAGAVSAWAGIHYFAAREPEEKGPLTWPEGNGWILQKLLAKLSSHIRAGSPAYWIGREGKNWRVRTESAEYTCDSVIFAAPTFTAQYLIEGAPKAGGFVYSPWITANLTLDRLPRDAARNEPAWDNVIYDSPALGYVDATHQSLGSRKDRAVWTWYWALADGEPAFNRQVMLQKSWQDLAEYILRDLERAHRDMRSCVSRIDIMRLGHAMGRPVPGFIASESRRWFAAHGSAGENAGLYYANSDLSGISIFEEAQYRGVRAADRALARVGGSKRS